MRTFEDQLKAFVFFHLGSDAKIQFQSDPDSLEVAVEHQRVQPFRFRLSKAEVARLASDRRAFEEYLLDLLTRYRGKP